MVYFLRLEPSVMKQFLLPIVLLVALVSLAGNVYLLKKSSPQRPLILVNGEPVRQQDLDDRVDFLYSKELLSKMIWTKLVLQEAARRNCVPTEGDVTTAIAGMDRANPSVTYSARKSDPNLVLFRDAIRTNLALRNLQVADITVTPSDVDAFYQSHLSMFTLPTQTQATAVIAKDEVARSAAKSMLAQGVAPDVIAATPGLKVVGVNVGLAGELPPEISARLLMLKPGQIGEYNLGKEMLDVRVVSVSPQSVIPLDRCRHDVELAAKLAKAPSASSVLLDLRRRASIVPVAEKYADAIPPVTQGIPSPAEH